MPGFVVARFPDGGVEVVSETWVCKDKKMARWPPGKNASAYKELLLNHHEPEPNWATFSIERSYGTYETYNEAGDRANNVATRGEESTCEEAAEKDKVKDDSAVTTLPDSFETPVTYAENSTRSRKRKSKSNKSKHSKKSKKAKKLKKASKDMSVLRLNDSLSIAPIVLPGPSRGSSTIRSNTPSNDQGRVVHNQSANGAVRTMTLPESNVNRNIGQPEIHDEALFRQKVLNHIDRVEEFMIANRRTILQMKVGIESLRQLKGADMLLEDDFNDWIHILPIDSEKKLKELENSLGDKKFKERGIAYLQRFCTKKLEETIRMVMSKVITDELASKYTFQGKRSSTKGNFSSLALCDLLLATIRSNTPTSSCTLDDLKKEGGIYLTKSNVRIARGEERRKRNEERAKLGSKEEENNSERRRRDSSCSSHRSARSSNFHTSSSSSDSQDDTSSDQEETD